MKSKELSEKLKLQKNEHDIDRFYCPVNKTYYYITNIELSYPVRIYLTKYQSRKSYTHIELLYHLLNFTGPDDDIVMTHMTSRFELL